MLAELSADVDNAFVKVTAPTTLDVLFDLTWCIPLLLPDFKPHSKAPDHLNMFNVQFTDRLKQVGKAAY